MVLEVSLFVDLSCKVCVVFNCSWWVYGFIFGLFIFFWFCLGFIFLGFLLEMLLGWMVNIGVNDKRVKLF